MRGVTVFAVLLGLLGALPAAAQGIDCSKARSRTETAICGSAGLRELDRRVSSSYAEAVAREPGRAGALQQAQREWLRGRDAACAGPSVALERCLSAQMTRRLTELSPPAAPGAVAVTPPAVSVARVPAVPSAANPAAPAATVAPASLPAAPQVDALLQVTSAGRFAIAASSHTGVALQVVDMLTGPSETVGSVGERDGRLDMLLDVGRYRVRAFAAEGANETVGLTVEPFRDAAPPRAFAPPGETLQAELRDKEQRAFWLVVPPSGQVQIEAAGRALADLRLWRDGRELTALKPAFSSIEPQPGHGMTDLRLFGDVEPGVYLAVAYGGPLATWTDGSAASPFYVRAGLSEALAEGWVGGAIGPFGSERYAAPSFAGSFRLDLKQPADAQLVVGSAAAGITRTSREPSARLGGTPGRIGVVEVRGKAGQAFTLRASETAGQWRVTQQGAYWVSAVTIGAGGDEAPPTVLLERVDPQDPTRIVAGNLPRLTPGTPWHGRFNLRGPTALLFENPQGGPVSVRTTGLSLRNDPGATSRYDLPAGYYVLRLAPEAGVQGALDVVVSVGPASAGGPAAALPPDPVIPLGIQAVGPRQSLQLSTQSAPGVTTFLSARPVPVALVEGPLMVTQEAGAAPLAIPVRIDAGGTLAVSELGGGPIAATMEAGRVIVPVADRARTIVLAWRRTVTDAPDIPPPPALAAVPSIVPGRPVPFDLARSEQRGFALDVANGGLFVVETTGRLHTSGRLATAFLPSLLTDDAGGVGENMRLQTFLRSGRYRVEVSARDSAGHLALVANPAPLATGATLVPGGSVRASMAAGAGVVFPVRIEVEGTYHLDLLGLGQPFVARLEDAEGWPVTAPGDLSTFEQKLRPGTYRLLVSPASVARQVIARLLTVLPEVAIVGHGPHALPFGSPQSATWREPPGRNDARAPDVWTFTLFGPADVTLSIGDGMVAELRQAADRAVARTTKTWSGRLEAGEYRVEASSLGRNDRLDYTIGVSAKQLQPDQKFSATLPAMIPFTLAASRVATVTSWGGVPVKAVLRREDGTEIVRSGARADDWNIAVSRRLPAGSYRLELAAAEVTDRPVAVPQDPGVTAPDSSDDSDAAAAEPDGQAAQSAPAAERGGGAAEAGDAADQTVEVRLALPESAVQVLDVPSVPEGALVLAQARSDDATVLALERQAAEGWRVVSLQEGRAPVVAAAGDGSAERWRIEAWPIDGGISPVKVTIRVLDGLASALGDVVLDQVDGMDVAAARIRLEHEGVLALQGASRVAAWPGHAAEAIEGGQVVAQGRQAWLIGVAGAAHVGALEIAPGQTGVVSVPVGGAAMLPAQTATAGRMLLWRADSGLGQPGLRTIGMAPGFALGSVLATAESAVTLGNADGDGAIRARTALIEVALQPSQPPGRLRLPPHSATPVTKAGAVTVTLVPGTGALGEHASAWAGDAPLTRSFEAGERLVLINVGDAEAPVAIGQADAKMDTLHPGGVFKRFFGAAGSIDLPVRDGGTLAVAGAAELTWLGDDGRMRRGRTLDVRGNGHVVVAHEAGAVVVSLTTPTLSPWPAVDSRDVALPMEAALSGSAMALRFTSDTAALLHATTTAPVLIGLGEAAPALFPSGAEFHVAVPAGPVMLRLYSPHDGPLSGKIALFAEQLRPLQEGVGAEVAVAPGGAAAFVFDLAQPATVGIGVRAVPDRVQVRLIDAHGAVLGEGVAQLRKLLAGRYVVEARVPPDAAPSVVRPAVVGITPRGNGPPPDVAARYRELVTERSP